MANLKETLESRQIWIYFGAIALGAALGSALPGSVIETLETVIRPALFFMLFATFMQVPITQVGRALRNGRFMSALLLSHFLVLPLIAADLTRFLPDDSLVRLAVLLVLLTPCIDYVITFTHLGGGNARLLLGMTPLLLVMQMLFLPIYLGVILGDEATQFISGGPFIEAFVWFIALPLLAAAVVQAAGRRTATGARLVSALAFMPVPSTALVLCVVVASVTPQIAVAHTAALAALPVYIAFALIAPLCGWVMSRLMRLDASATTTVSFSASYRNSLVILPLAFAIPGGTPVVPAVILTQTLTELVFLPVYLRWIPRLTRLRR